MFDRIRYGLGVFSVVLLPSGLLFWFVIHPLARVWRRLGAARAYSIVLPVTIIVGALLFRERQWLLGRDLGTQWSLIAVALALYAPMVQLERRYWRQLSIPR